MIIGIPRVFYQTVASPGLAITVRPPVGFEWQIMYLYGWCDESGKVPNWAITDGKYSFNSNVANATRNANLPFSLSDIGVQGTALNMTPGVKLTYDCYAVWSVNSLTAGKNIFVSGYFIEQIENADLYMWEKLGAKLGIDFPWKARNK